MSFIRPVLLVTALTFLGSTAWAADQKDHQVHHPEAAASSSKAPKAAASGASANESMVKMDTQIKAMREMHEKMMNAKTPEERNALMAQHMKFMQGGMAMMAMMGGMGGMGGMDGMGSDAEKDRKKGSMPPDMAAHHQMMEKRMEMMETMMPMMMDRLPATPAK